MEGTKTCDILIVGGGAAGLAAAAAVQDKNLKVVLIDKEDHVGGTTFRSGGTVWAPNNYLMQEFGIEDSKEQAARYIKAELLLRHRLLMTQQRNCARGTSKRT